MKAIVSTLPPPPQPPQGQPQNQPSAPAQPGSNNVPPPPSYQAGIYNKK